MQAHSACNKRFLYAMPQSCIAKSTGCKLVPSSVSEYSTRGGTSAYTRRVIRALASICRSCEVST